MNLQHLHHIISCRVGKSITTINDTVTQTQNMKQNGFGSQNCTEGTKSNLSDGEYTINNHIS